MGVEEYFQVDEESRTIFIECSIVAKLPGDTRDSTKQRATQIVDNYVGRDRDALSVLAYAAERGEFEEYATKLEAHHKKSLQFVHPEARASKQVPGVDRADVFLLECYKKMGVQPPSEPANQN